MKQILQDVRNGETIVRDLPRPVCGRGELLIRTTRSLISAGTERSLVEFGKSGWIDKARQQPDKVKMVLDKLRTDGVVETVSAVRSKLNQPLPLGYSNVGVVVEVGEGVRGFSLGDRVLSNGHHAEFVAVPKNLCARIPDAVDDETAAFGVLGAIALQGVRLSAPTIGETFAVFGLGLLGLLTVQILRANGCRVIGIDLDRVKLDLAASMGADVVRLDQGEDAVARAASSTGGVGVDGAIITASATNDDIVHDAAQMCRKRGRIVLVGVVGLNLRRSDFFEKELSFQVSCSYGPGRYDPTYESEGHDYPVGFVRWTENRNFQAVLGLMEDGSLDPSSLRSGAYRIADAQEAYERLMEDRGALGILIEYPAPAEADPQAERQTVRLRGLPAKTAPVVVGAFGAGNYAGRVLLPAFKACNVRMKSVVSTRGRSGDQVAKDLGFEVNSTDPSAVLEDPEINVVVIGTRHDSHADLVVRALEAGKNVFVEKPLALDDDELDEIEASLARNRDARLMVGFNRRFAPLVGEMKRRVDVQDGPTSLTYTCNAGHIPPDSWVHDPGVGGGRILGEACHFIDLARFLVGYPLSGYRVSPMRSPLKSDSRDSAVITLEFEDGSVGVVSYFANGHRSYPKERVEVFRGGHVFALHNFRRLSWYGPSKGSARKWRQDKGQRACVAEFVASVSAGIPSPILPEELIEVSRAAIAVGQRVYE